MERESFKSRLGFLLVSAGCAIGIGNVWRFPFVVGQNGGGFFVLVYLVMLVVLGLPVLTMELAVGRASRKSTASKPLVAHLSSASADRTQIYNSKAQKPRKISIFRGFLIPFSSDCF